MAKKAPRRTAQRIQDAALALFNRYGEPNVSTSQIAGELGISPGNLHYHYPAKDGLINSLFEQYQLALAGLLPAAADVRDVEDAWFFLHSLFERIWQYRFLYRDLNLLLSRNRRLESGIQQALRDQTAALQALLQGLRRHGAVQVEPDDDAGLATRQVVLLSYWLSFEYARDPRHALEPEGVQAAVLRGAGHALGLLLPYLVPAQQAHLRQLLLAYESPDPPEPRMSDLKARFEAAVADSKNLSERPDNMTLLKIYALYKQATQGDPTEPRPGFSDMVGRAKWDAWNALKGKSADEAMQDYIALIESLG